MKISDYFPKAQSPQNRTGTQRVDSLTSSVARLRISGTSSRARPLNLHQTPNGLVRAIPRNMHGSVLIQPSRGMAEKLEQIQKNPFVLQCLELEDRENEELVLFAAKININVLEHAGPGLKSSGEFFVKVVSQQFTKSQYNPPEFEELVIVGCKGDKISTFEETKIRSGFEYANESLHSNIELVRKLVKIYGIALKDAAPFIQDDQKTVQLAAMNNPIASAFASEKLLDNKEYVLRLLKEGGDDDDIDLIFPFLSNRLRGDIEVVSETYHSTDESQPQEFLPDNTRDNEEFFLKICEIHDCDSSFLEEASDKLKSKADFMLKLQKIDPNYLEFSDPSLFKNSQFMLDALVKDIEALELAHASLLNSPRFMLKAIRINSKSTKYIAQGLKNDRRFKTEVVKILKSKEASRPIQKFLI